MASRRLLASLSLRSALREAEALRRRSERHPALFWSRRVNRRIGAIIALLLLRTRVTPNEVSIAGLVAQLGGAALVLLAPTPAPLSTVVLVFLIWQLGLSLDCADGQLARARGSGGPFGAWLDQILDFVTHTAVTGSLVIFGVRALGLGAVEAAAVAILALAGNLIGVFASAQRNALIGTRPAIDASANTGFRVLLLGRHLIDYGAFLAVWSVALAWPPLLLPSLIAAAILALAAVITQVGINWPRAGRDETVSRSP
jgi:phosphatidylglycerophosphate synthase